MKTFIKGVLLATGITVGAGSLPAAQDWTEQYFKAKLGRNSPAEDARLRAEGANTAFREAAVDVAAPDWIEQHLKGKVGRNTPAEEARLRDAQQNTAFRQEPVTVAAPNWIEQHIKGKLGR